jgi:DNA-binding response OmpR family regulator
MSPVPKILVVEDDDAIRALLVAALRREPFDVHAAMHGAHALNMTQTTDYAVILLDLMMPTLNGIEFLEAFHQASPQSRTVIFVMTAGDDTVLRRMPSNVVHGIVHKPFDVPQLLAMVREVTLARSEQTPEPAVDAVVAEAGNEQLRTDRPN